MAGEWKEVQLGDLVSIKHGWPFKSGYFTESSDLPVVVAIGNFQYSGGFRFDSTPNKHYSGDYPREYTLAPGDILLVMTCQTAGGEILGIPARTPNDGRVYLHNQRLGRVQIASPLDVDPSFLYWLFLDRKFNEHLVQTASGSKILHTAPSRIESFRFRLPPLGEQRAIARILGALDDKIELNRRMNETLEQLARALFKSWFVDFDPVRAKAEGRQPEGIDPATAALFPSRLVDSPLGPIPEGWEVRPLDTIAHFRNGLALQRFPPEGDESLPVIKIADMRSGITERSDRASTNIPPDYIVHDGDLLFSWSGSLIAKLWTHGRGALNQHLFKVTSTEFPRWFYYHWVLHHLPEFQRIAADKATTMGHIQRHHLSGAKVLVPPNELLTVGTRLIEPLLKKQVANDLQSRTLTKTRDTLLPKLISGELRVPDPTDQ